MAILLDEAEAQACMASFRAADDVLISAVTYAKSLVVSARRTLSPETLRLLDESRLSIIPVTRETARRVAAVYDRWGKGVHPAGLNFGGCFAYEVARQHDCPLLFVGEDFSRTDGATPL